MSVPLLALVVAFPLRPAARSPVQVQAHLGISGVSSRRGWNYVVAHLRNTGPPVTCRLQVHVEGDPPATYAKRVTLPTLSRKRGRIRYPSYLLPPLTFPLGPAVTCPRMPSGCFTAGERGAGLSGADSHGPSDFNGRVLSRPEQAGEREPLGS